MFQSLGQLVSRRWYAVWLGWVVLTVTVFLAAPRWEEVVESGEFAFLPADSPSRTAEARFAEAFPLDLLSSSMVIVVRRPSRPEGLTTAADVAREEDSDFYFIDEILKPAILQIAEEEGGRAEGRLRPLDDPQTDSDPAAVNETKSIIAAVRTPSDRDFAKILLSEDRQAALIMVELTTGFMDASNMPTIAKIETLLTRLRQEQRVPSGIDLSLSGPATVGRDLIQAGDDTTASTNIWITILVVLLLLIIYRAPLLVLIPFVTVAVSVAVSLRLLSLLSLAGVVDLFRGIETYIRVILYGAGLNFCLFLIARYKEEIDAGTTADESVTNAISKVGIALTASAGTLIGSIGMMYFAQFRKFQQAGLSISLSLVVCLLAVLTLTPVLLRMTGKWAFWPHLPKENLGDSKGWISKSRPFKQFWGKHWFQTKWNDVGQALLQKPLRIWSTTLVCMAPFAVVGVLCHDFLSYGLLTELDPDTASVQGAKAVQEHFPAGATGPVTVLLTNHDLDFSRAAALGVIEDLTLKLKDDPQRLGIEDVRSFSHPLGGEEPISQMDLARRVFVRNIALKHYVSTTGEYDKVVTKFDIIFRDDPFSRNSIQRLEKFREQLTELVETSMPEAIRPHVLLRQLGYFDPSAEWSENTVHCQPEGQTCEVFITDPTRWKELVAELKDKFLLMEGVKFVDVVYEPDAPFDPTETQLVLEAKPGYFFSSVGEAEKTIGKDLELHLLGGTPSIRDLKQVTDVDQIRIDILVLCAVLLILVLVLRKPAISVYLLLSVFFSYLVTLGVTFAFFWLIGSGDFTGLDWKVPIFLFTILIAIGEDYNIFLMTRIEEEQAQHGRVNGVTVALQRTGGIISCCGIVMAGTFASLLPGSLVSMQQLGFALTFGVLLDTFVVRPILVPAWLILLHTGRFGRCGKYLGAAPLSQTAPDA